MTHYYAAHDSAGLIYAIDTSPHRALYEAADYFKGGLRDQAFRALIVTEIPVELADEDPQVMP